MLSPKTTTSPARRAPEERTPLRHIIHHEEADGTIHYLCGIRRAPDAAVKGTHPDKMVLLQPPTVLGPNPGKWTRGFNHDAIVSVANPAASKAFGER